MCLFYWPTVDVTYGEQCSQAVRLNCLIMDIAVMIQYCLYVGSTSLFYFGLQTTPLIYVRLSLLKCNYLMAQIMK